MICPFTGPRAWSAKRNTTRWVFSGKGAPLDTKHRGAGPVPPAVSWWHRVSRGHPEHGRGGTPGVVRDPCGRLEEDRRGNRHARGRSRGLARAPSPSRERQQRPPQPYEEGPAPPDTTDMLV